MRREYSVLAEGRSHERRSAGHYKDLTETGNRARKVSGTQGMAGSVSERIYDAFLTHFYRLSIMPRVKPSSYNLRKETCFKPKINTMRFKNSFIDRLVFKYVLAM